jgi:hypothetical protein
MFCRSARTVSTSISAPSAGIVAHHTRSSAGFTSHGADQSKHANPSETPIDAAACPASSFCRHHVDLAVVPAEVITDRAPTYPRVLDRLWPAAWHHVERYANNRIESDHAQLKRWLRAMCGIKTMIGLRILAAGHALVQNLRRGHYEIAADQPTRTRLAAAFSQLATAI